MTTTTTNPAAGRAGDLSAAIDRVIETYHAPLRSQLARLDRIMSKVAAYYGLAYLQLQPLAQLFVELERALRTHVTAQEEQLFPLLRQSTSDEKTRADLRDALVAAIHDGKQNDERISSLFHQIADLTNGYDASCDACSTYRDIVHALGTLDEQTCEHFQTEAELATIRAAKATRRSTV